MPEGKNVEFWGGCAAIMFQGTHFVPIEAE